MIVNALKDFTTALSVLGHPGRLRTLTLISQGELTVSELVEVLGLSQPRVTQYIKSLESAGIVQRVREGSWVFSRIRCATPEISKLVTTTLSLLPEDDTALLTDMRRLERVRNKRAEIAEEFFANVAKDSSQLTDDYLPHENIEAKMNELIATRRFDHMVDMGTGTARMLTVFSDRAKVATGIDNNIDMLKVARHNLMGAKNTHVSLCHGDLTATNLSSGVADFVTIHQVLHYLDYPGKAISEASRILAKDGLLLIVDFASHTNELFREKYAHRRLGFSDDDIFDWFEKNELKLINSSLVRTSVDQPDVRLWLGQNLQNRSVLKNEQR